MTIHVSLEKMEDRWIAYATSFTPQAETASASGLFGCFASDISRDAALAALPSAVTAYQNWCVGHDCPLTGLDPHDRLDIDEIIAGWIHPENGEEVAAFFTADLPPLTPAEIAFAARLMAWTSADLISAFAGLPAEILERRVVGDWSIRGIAYHAARADRWYLSTLDLAPDWSTAPASDLATLLTWTNDLTLAALPRLMDTASPVLKGVEWWTPRKFLRRALWHRRDHTAHIGQFLDKLGYSDRCPA